MIVVAYDAVHGLAVPDGALEDWVLTIKEKQAGGKSAYLTFASEIVITAIRLAIKQGRIHYYTVAFEYKGQRMNPDPDGNLEMWPEGFCDTNEKLIFKLL